MNADNKISGVNYDICETQADIFEQLAINPAEKWPASQEIKGYFDFNSFVTSYMKSDWCKRAMDTIYSRFQLETVLECSEFFLPEIKNKLIITEKPTISADVANWIGFIYRALYIRTKIPSAALIEKVPLNVLYGYYPGLHTVEEEMQVDILCEKL